MAPPFARATFYNRHNPRSTFAMMVAATKKPGDEPGFSAVRLPANSPTPRQSEPHAHHICKFCRGSSLRAPFARTCHASLSAVVILDRLRDRPLMRRANRSPFRRQDMQRFLDALDAE